MLARHGERLVMSAPDELRGKLEVRGLGILSMPAAPPTPLDLVVDLTASEEVTRLPDPACTVLLGLERPRIALASRGRPQTGWTNSLPGARG